MTAITAQFNLIEVEYAILVMKSGKQAWKAFVKYVKVLSDFVDLTSEFRTPKSDRCSYLTNLVGGNDTTNWILELHRTSQFRFDGINSANDLLIAHTELCIYDLENEEE